MATPVPATPAPVNPYNINFQPWGPPSVPKVNANADAQAYFNQQSAEDQAKIRESWGGRPAPPPTGGGPHNGFRNMLYNNYQNSYMNQWYDNARNAGSPVPATPPAAPAAPAAPQPYQPPQPNGQPANAHAATAAQPGGYDDWRANGSQPNPNGGVNYSIRPPLPPQPGGPVAGGAVANMLTTNYQPPAAPAAPRDIGQEYEAWKAGGRQGPRPQGT
jgi:hypothetical protein